MFNDRLAGTEFMITMVCQKCGQRYEVVEFNTRSSFLPNKTAREKAKAKNSMSNLELLHSIRCPKCKWNNLLEKCLRGKYKKEKRWKPKSLLPKPTIAPPQLKRTETEADKIFKEGHKEKMRVYDKTRPCTTI